MNSAIELEREAEGRRIVALALPEFLTELAGTSFAIASGGEPRLPRHRRSKERNQEGGAPPLGVLLVESEGTAELALRATAFLAAVNESAKRFGVRAGQTIAAAHALVARLIIREVTRERVAERLGEIAEVAMGFGPVVSIEPPDTVWVDVTGAAHLAGGEEALVVEMAARVRTLGHVVRVAVSSGPKLAQAFARWGRMSREGTLVVPAEATATRIAELPVRVLPIGAEHAGWFVRLGIHTVGELARLPRAAAAARLGENAGRILDLAGGRDESPLVRYEPVSIPKEETTWDEPINGAEPLLFVLRGLV